MALNAATCTRSALAAADGALPLAEARTDTQVPRVVRRIEGGDPRPWALVTVLGRPFEVNFIALDLRLSTNYSKT